MINLNAEKLADDNVTFNVIELALQRSTENDYLYWNGEFQGKSWVALGKNCQLIKPELDINENENIQAKYFFDRQLILDMGVHYFTYVGFHGLVQRCEVGGGGY